MKTKSNYIFLLLFVLLNHTCFGQAKGNVNNSKSATNQSSVSPEQMRQKAISLCFGMGESKIDEVAAKNLFEEAISKGDVMSLMWRGVGMSLGMFNYQYDQQKGGEAIRTAYKLTQAKTWAGDPEATYLFSFAYAINTNDDNQIKTLMEASAAKGFEPAVISMALKKFAEYKYQEAVDDLKNLSAKGNKKAATLLGSMYFNESTDIYNEKEALQWTRKGADFGDPSAMLKLAQLYYEGKNLAKNVSEAKKWAKLAYDKGYSAGLKFLGKIYTDSKNAEQIQTAISMYTKAAETGDGDAALELGLWNLEGTSFIKKNEQKAFALFRKAAEAGQPNAMAILGAIYGEGKIVKKNTTLSRYWTNLAEENGLNVSTQKATAESPFVTIMKNADFSPRYYRVTTYGGDEYVVRENADIFDGLMSGLFTGWIKSRQNQQEMINGIEEVANTKTAKTYAATITTFVHLPEPLLVGSKVRISSKGYVVLGMFAGGAGPNGLGGGAMSGYSAIPALPHAAIIGRIGENKWFFIGEGGEMKVEQSGKLQIAINDADYTNNKGYFDVTVTIYKGSAAASVGIDEKSMQAEIVSWYKKAAENGNPDAQLLLAQMYLKGEGIAQNNEEAFKWFKFSARQGNTDALYNVASMYAQGKGTPRNVEEAILSYEELEKKSNQYKIADDLKKLRSEYLMANLSKVNVRTGKMKGDIFDIDKKYGSVSTKVEVKNLGQADFELSGSSGSGKKVAAFFQDDKRSNRYFINNNKLNLAGKWELKGKPKWITNANGETEVLFEGQFISFFDNRGELNNTPYPCTMTATITKQGLKGIYIISLGSRSEFKGIMELNFSDK